VVRSSAASDVYKRQGRHYPILIPDQPALAGVRVERHGELSMARGLASSEVSLPIHPQLTGEEVERVIAAVNEWPAEDPAEDPTKDPMEDPLKD
jgi:dTDP-4-amino-4,6-dideoxygalactose transaminase